MKWLSKHLIPVWNKIMVALKFYSWASWHRIKHGQRCSIEVQNQKLYVQPFDKRSYLIKHSNGRLQENLISTWKSLIELDADYYIDVGANYGVFSLHSVKNGQNTLSLEPNPELAECLRLSFAQDHNCKILEVAAQDKNQDEMNFYFTPSFSGTSSLAQEVASGTKSSFLQMWPHSPPPEDPSTGEYPNQKVQQTRVRARRLTDLLSEVAEKTIKSLVLKVDVEGFEPEVLDGAREILNECDWWRGIFEFDPNILKKKSKSPKSIWKKFKKFPGYVIKKDSTTKKNFHDLSNYELPKVPSRATDILIGQGKTL